MYTLKRIGESADPCGRPDVIVLTSEDNCPTLSDNFLFSKALPFHILYKYIFLMTTYIGTINIEVGNKVLTLENELFYVIDVEVSL